MMGLKRKRAGEEGGGAGIQTAYRPAIGTRTFPTGKAIKHGLATSPLQSLIALGQQIHTVHSDRPLAISHPIVQVLQQYLDVSPALDEILEAWRDGDKHRNDKLIESSVSVVKEIIDILSPIPYFRKAVSGIVARLISSSEPYADLLNGLIQSAKREQSLLALRLAAAAIHVEPPEVGSSSSASLSLKVWSCLVEGGSSKIFGKLLGMRRRTKDGNLPYGANDPLDKPDIRHAALHIILPLLPTSTLLSNVKSMLQPLYSNMAADPPITVYRVLAALWSAMSNSSQGIARKTALVLLDERALEHLLSLLSHHTVEPTSGKPVSEIVLAFLEAVTATPGTGICFPDQGWYPRRLNRDDEEPEAGPSRIPAEASRSGLHNRILSNVLRKIGSKAADDHSKVGEWAIKVFASIPETVAGYWAYSALSLEPRLEAKWISTISYVGRIISLPPPPRATYHQSPANVADPTSMPPRSSAPSVATMIESILPSPLTKVHLSKGLQHSHELVQNLTAQTLARALQKLLEVLDLLRSVESELEDPIGSDNAWSRVRYELEMEARRRVPDVLVVIAFAQKSATLARVADDEEPDPAAVARSAMLTEIALRLLGLYHHTLPSITQEMKFDVGKLLVSSSSVKAERRAKKDHRAGSVISDAGSVASVGTMGTAGMGGGFGQDRGDVDGFEALSQAHVLSLLGAAEGWQWSKKAAGSQYTYLYHILLLHLSAPHPITQTLTTNLIHQLLGSTLMFEHDPGELEVFVSSLPRTHPGDVGEKAKALAQQIHILSFIDDCVRRFMKTPYRYIEDTLAMDPEYFDPSLRSREMISGLLMTILEQLKAKILGELISTEAVGYIMAYLRRVILGLSGKVSQSSVLSAYVDRLDEAIAEARKLGQERKGLRSHIDLLRRDIGKVFGGEISRSAQEEAPNELADEAEWSRASFEQSLLYPGTEIDLPNDVIESATSSSAERYAKFTLHLFRLPKNSSAHLLHLIVASMKRVTGIHLEATKGAVFNDSTMNIVLEDRSSRSPSMSEAIDELVSLLQLDNPTDQHSAHSFIHGRLAALCHTKKRASLEFIKILTALVPWKCFLTTEEAKELLVVTCKQLKSTSALSIPNGTKAESLFTEELKRLLAKIIQTADGLVDSLKHIDVFVKAGLLEPIVYAWKAKRRHDPALLTIDISTRTINDILDTHSQEAFHLLTALVEACPSAAKSLLDAATGSSSLLQDPRSYNTLSLALEMCHPKDFPYTALIATTLRTLSDDSDTQHHDAAFACLTVMAKHQPALINEAATGLQPRSYTASLALFARSLAEDGISEVRPAVLHVLRIGLRKIIQVISDEQLATSGAVMDPENIQATLRSLKDIELDVNLVETVIIAVIQEALQNPSAVELAAALCTACTLKASFVRQYLGRLLESKTFIIVSRTSNHPAHAAIVNLVASFFKASMYAACQPNFVEPLLALYHGTLSHSDRQVLAIFHTFEKFRHLSIGSLLATWSATGSSSRAFEALTTFDSGKVFKTCIEFPLRRILNGEDEDIVGANDSLYDPVFVLSLLALSLQEPLSGLEWVEVLRSNVLGVAACALSSRDQEMRALGAAVLAKAMYHLPDVTFYEKAQLEHSLRLLQHAVTQAEQAEQTMEDIPPTLMRLPTLTTLFFAHVLRSISTPSHPLYASTSQFLLQRPTLDMWDVPMLFGMLYASGDGYKRDRSWIVRLIRDGTRSQADWSLLKRRKTVDLLKTLFQRSTDVAFRRLILQAMHSITLVPAAALSLVYKSGMIQWIETQWATAGEAERDQLLSLMDNLIVTLVSRHRSKGDEPRSEGSEDWLGLVERVILAATSVAHPRRLESLASILLRLAPVLSAAQVDPLLRALVDRLDRLRTNSPDALSPLRNTIIENIFNASMNIRDAAGSTPYPTKRIGELVLELDSPVGAWARKELRQAHWEAHANGLQ